MPTSSFKLFDENKANMLTDSEYSSNAQRLNGVQSGVASSKLQNKFQYQASLVAYAIAQLMVQNGYDATDSTAVTTFVNNMSNTMLQKVVDKATDAQAKEGTNTTKWMTPALVKSAITELAPMVSAILSNETKALYGLGTGAVPDDVLAWIGAYNTYWWRRRTPGGARYVEVQSDIHNAVGLFGPSVETSQVIYSKQLTIDQNNGNAALGDALTLPKTSGQELAEAIVANAPLYVSVSGTIYCIPDGATAGAGSNPSFNNSTIMYYKSSNKDYVYINGSGAPLGKTVTTERKQIPAGDWEYVQSSNRNAYPDSGTQDGYEYEYLGIPFDNAVTAPKIETGSYVGTGTYGQANPNTLTFGFAPQLVIFPHISDYNGCPEHLMFYVGTRFYEISNGITGTLEGRELSWYSTMSASEQFNVSGTTYYYFAIG